MLTKYASTAVLSAEMGNQRATFRTAHRHAFTYEKRPGYLYVRSRAISSRCNDNYDEFPAEEIKKGYRSFVGKPVFVNHRNDNHRRARGVVIDAALHEDTNPDGSPDTWVEVLMEVDAVKFPKLAKAILAGEVDRTSMGTDVAFSVCSFCGNKAATPLEYCAHIPKLKGKRIRRRTANGHQEDVLVREICYGLKFFENSLLVEEPADPTAFFLGVEAVTASTSPGVTEAMLRAVGPDHQKTARICGEYAPEEYFPNECPSWQPYYYASWIKPDGRILAVTGHDDAPGKQAGAFSNGWVRMMVTDYPKAPYLQAEIHGWPVTGAQASAFHRLADELEARHAIIQVSDAAEGNGTYTIPGTQIGSFLRQPVPVGGKGRGSVSEFYDRFSSLNASFAKLAWTETEHPRGGNPENPGQFSTKPGGGGGKSEAPKSTKPATKPVGVPKSDKPFAEKKADDYRPKKLPPEERAKHPRGSQENPHETDDVSVAAEALWKGEWVELKQPQGVTLLAEHLEKLKDWAKAQNAKDKDEWVAAGGDPALYEMKGFNLCRITVPGTNLFCEETKDIPRIKMPQLKANNPLPGSKAESMERDSRGEIDLNPLFKDMLREKGIEVTDKNPDGSQKTMRSSLLKATQNELQGEKIGFFLNLLRTKGPEAVEGAIFVSRDGYIVDGHHRWAGFVAYDLEDGSNGDVDMAVDVIDLDIIDILRMANDFCLEYGLPAQDATSWAGYDPNAAKAAALNRAFAALVVGYRDWDVCAYCYREIVQLEDGSWVDRDGGDEVCERANEQGKSGHAPSSSTRLAYGETKAPAQVDTLRDANCPVCGEETAYDGEKCMVCGFIKPPDAFMDPDLEKAQQVDLRQEQDEDMPGGTTLVCDECGAKFQSQGGEEKPPNPFAEKEEEDADEEAGDSEEKPAEKAKKKSAPPWADKKKSSTQVKHRAGRGEMDELAPAFRNQLKQLQEQGINNKGQPPVRACQYCDGPAVFDRIYMSFPSTIAVYNCPDCHKQTNYRPLPPGEEPPEDEKRFAAKVAVDRWPESKPPLLSAPTMEKPKGNDALPADAEAEDIETTPQAGDTCPECGQGTLRPVGHEHMDDNPEKTPPKDDEKKDGDKPPWEKGDESKEKDQKTSAVRRGPQKEESMRPALAALAEQQRIIDSQRRQIKALRQAVNGIARLAGVDQHPKFAALMKLADEDNPAQPIADPPAEAPVQTTEEALGDLNDEDVEAQGATGLTDVSADATTDVLSTEVVLDEPLDLNEQNVEAPVAGTEGPRPLDEVKTETEVRIGDPNNPETKFPLEGPFAERATTGAREARTVACLRLARLRVQAGIASGDDLALATAIASSETSDEVIQAEIDTLSKVVRQASRQQAPRNLVPRMASTGNPSGGTVRVSPSLSEAPFQAPEMQVVGSVDPDELLFE